MVEISPKESQQFAFITDGEKHYKYQDCFLTTCKTQIIWSYIHIMPSFEDLYYKKGTMFKNERKKCEGTNKQNTLEELSVGSAPYG